MTLEVLKAAQELTERGEPFVLATVVWRRRPTSGKEGAKALIDADGWMRGWLGGACAEPAVIREARRALRDGSPRLMYLGPPEELPARHGEGLVAVPIACQSEGAMEVYLEPVLPSPHVVIVGRSPAVDALARMATALDWRATVVDDGGSARDHERVEEVITTLDLEKAGVSDRSAVLVATQGHYDEEALERALATPAPYVGLVTSRKRAETVLAALRDRGVPEEALKRVRAPAGLDLGEVDHSEIAVAILAELVRLRAAGELAGAAASEEPAAAEAVDPVCGMTVEVPARYRATFTDETYWFCSQGCRRAFEVDPERYASGGEDRESQPADRGPAEEKR